MKKNNLLVLLALLLISIFPSKSHAQCDAFSFPFKNAAGNILFFDCNTGEMNTFTPQSVLSQVKTQRSLGAFIHKISWSPDGKKILVLSENVSAATQELLFFSPERKADSLNWWLYDLTTDKATILDEHVQSVGWASNDSIIYNWDNIDFSISQISDLSQHQKIASVTNDTNSLDDNLTPQTLGATIIFPMETGFYKINPATQTSKYFPIQQKLNEIITNPFNPDSLYLLANNSIYFFESDLEKLTTIADNFSASSIATYDPNTIAVLISNRPSLYNISSKTLTNIDTMIKDSILKLYSFGADKELIFVTQNNVYRKIGSSVTELIIKPTDSTANQNPSNTQPAPIPQSPQTSFVMIYVYLGLATIVTILLAWFGYKKFIKKDE